VQGQYHCAVWDTHVPLRFDGANHKLSPSEPDGRPMAPTPDILRGTFDLLILRALSWGPAHGYAVARWIEQATDDALEIGEGTLYPALHRLEERDWITARWGPSENNRRAKFYSLTKTGRAQLRVETDNWRRYAAAIFAALEAPALR
jgi:PadR family transcriptional regulator, regulatory protein PadR